MLEMGWTVLILPGAEGRPGWLPEIPSILVISPGSFGGIKEASIHGIWSKLMTAFVFLPASGPEGLHFQENWMKIWFYTKRKREAKAGNCFPWACSIFGMWDEIQKKHFYLVCLCTVYLHFSCWEVVVELEWGGGDIFSCSSFQQLWPLRRLLAVVALLSLKEMKSFDCWGVLFLSPTKPS